MKKSIYIILTFLLIFCVFYGVRYVKSPLKTEPAISKVYENVVNAEGYIIKTEQVCNAPTSGIIYHYVKEGTRVKKNNLISTIYTGEASEETLAELSSITKKIEELEASGNASYTFSANSEENIETIKDNIIKAKNDRNVEKMSDYKMQIKSSITGSAQDIQRENLNALLEKKQSLETKLQYCKNDIYSQISGVFSKNIDGLESLLTPDSVANYTVSDYYKIPQTNQDEKYSALAGEPTCKVVNNHIWYVLAKVSAETAKQIKNGQTVKMRFANLPGIEAEGNVMYISAEDSKAEENVILVKFEQYKEGVFSIRHSDIELVLESYEGYKLPVSAIHIVDGEKGVMIKSDGGTKFRKCRIVYTDTTTQTVIIKPLYEGSSGVLSEYDNIIIGEK